MTGRLAPALLLAALLLAPGLAQACPYCLSGSDETREAYWGTTLLLAFLPVLLVAAGGLWLRHVARLARDDAALADAEERSPAYQE